MRKADDLVLTRRTLLGALGAWGLGALLGCGGSGVTVSAPEPRGRTRMYRLAVGDRRASRAAKANAANKRFATFEAALDGRAHPGDRSRPVPLDTTAEVWLRLFGDGKDTVDLRHVGDARGVA